MLLEEAELSSLKNDLDSISPSLWTNTYIIKTILEEYEVGSVPTAKEVLKDTLCSFYKDKIMQNNSSKFVKKRAAVLLNTAKLVVDSNSITIMLIDKLDKVTQQVISGNLRQEAFSIMKEGKSSTKKSYQDAGEDDTLVATSSKKRKYLKAKNLKNLSSEAKLHTLSEYYGEDGVLDMTKKATIPKRFQRISENIFTHFNLNLEVKLTNEEYEILSLISDCESKEALYDSVDKINPFTNDSSELPYVKLAIQKLCNLLHQGVFQSEHHKDWYRSNVYGDVFDFIFSSKSGYITKRSECHSLVIKSLKKLGLLDDSAKNVRSDFIFSHVNTDINAGFFCEDKPNEEECLKDNKKSKALREKSLEYWSHMLPYKGCIKYITSISCQFNKLKLQVKATKIIDGITVHVCLKEVRIPSDGRDGATMAEYLTTIISLLRMVTENFDKIRIMVDIAKKDDLVFVSSTPVTYYRENSPCSTNDTNNSKDSNLSQDPKDAVRELRIMDIIDNAMEDFNKRSSRLYLDSSWEEMF